MDRFYIWNRRFIYEIEDKQIIYHFLFICFCFVGTSQSDSVFQSPSQMEIKEGESVSLFCNFSSSYSTSPDLFWYRQHMGRGPQLIFHAYKNPQRKNHFAEGKFSTTLFLENKTVPLTIEGATLQDEAVYFCALRPTVSHLWLFVRAKTAVWGLSRGSFNFCSFLLARMQMSLFLM